MRRAPRVFKDDDFEFMSEIALGATAYRAAEVGEVLATVQRIKNGDFASWVGEWEATAARVREVASGCEAAGRRVSAREAYLRASTYYAKAAFFVMGTEDGDRLPELWRWSQTPRTSSSAPGSPGGWPRWSTRP
jgi:hypothetical protein